MKKVLFLTPYNPFEHPLGAASQSVAYRLAHLAEIAEVEVITFPSPRDTGNRSEGLKSIAKHIVLPPPQVSEERSSVLRLYRVLSGRLKLFGQMANLAAALGGKAASLMDRNTYDLIHIDDVIIHGAADYCPPSQRKIFFFHNLMTLQYRNLYRSRRTVLKKILAFVEYLHIKSHERKALSSMETIVVLTPPEEKIVRILSPHTTVFRIPLEVDLNLYRPDPGVAKPYHLLFTGTMSYEPNREGAVYFIEKIFPLIRDACPQTRLFIVGMNPPKDLLALANDNVIITGAVPSIIPYLKEAAVIVVPLLTGGGMRFKILEAFAMAKAVVSTSVGAEGIEWERERNIAIADEPVAFAEAVIGLLHNPQRAQDLGREARILIERVYATEVVKHQWQDLYRCL